MPEWLESILADTTALQLVFWFIAISALIGALIKFWPLLSNGVTIVNALVKLPEFIERTDDRLKGIHHETHKNDGSSIKDAVLRVEAGVKGLNDKYDALAAADAAIRQDLERTKPRARATKPKE